MVHALVVGLEFVLASEAVAFSIVLASDNRAREIRWIVAVLSAGVATEIRTTL